MLSKIPRKLKIMRESSDQSKTMRVRLSTLWIFAVLNYIYGDVFTIFNTLYDPAAMKDLMSGHNGSGPVHMTSGAFLGFAILMESSMVMVPISRFVSYRTNRWANIIVGFIHTVAALLFFFVGGLPTAFTYTAVFVVFEVIATGLIVWWAWKWNETKAPTA
jgi:hypothetical protein